MAAKRSTDDQKSRVDRFKEATRALACDEDGAAFDQTLKAIAKQTAGATNT